MMSYMASKLRLKCYEVWTPGSKRSRFMTQMALKHLLLYPLSHSFPDCGQTFVFNNLWPFGSIHSWNRVVGGLSLEELVDSNLKGKVVING